jgi:hypothetical protein
LQRRRSAAGRALATESRTALALRERRPPGIVAETSEHVK